MIQAKLLKADLHGAIISGNFCESMWSFGDCCLVAVLSLASVTGHPEVSLSYKQ